MRIPTPHFYYSFLFLMCFPDRLSDFLDLVFLCLSNFFLFDYLEKNADFPEKLCFVLFNFRKRDDELIFCSSNSK